MTHLKPRSATVTLYQGDDMDRLAALQRRVTMAERIAENGAATERYGDDNPTLSEARAAFDAFVDEAAERALTIEIRTIGREFFRDLLAAHPPRMVPKKMDPPPPGETVVLPEVPEMVEHDEDSGWGINTETFPTALLTFRKLDDEGDEPELVVTIAQPEFKTEAKVRRFVNRELSEGDFDQLWRAAYMLNRTPTQDPKAFVHSMSDSLSTVET